MIEASFSPCNLFAVFAKFKAEWLAQHIVLRSGMIVLILFLGGCATSNKPDSQLLDPPITVSLIQIPLRDHDAVRSVVAGDHLKITQKADDETAKAIVSAHAQVLAETTRALADLPGWRVNSIPLELPDPLLALPIQNRKQPLDPDMLKSLQMKSGSDMLLRIGISDYGATPKTWRSGVITFEVVTTLGIAAIAYVRPATRAIAGAYLVQEAVEETAEAYSGFWALDQVYRPVRVEAELIDLRTGSTVWADSATGFSDRRLMRMFTAVTDEERQTQLRTALHDAIRKVMERFQDRFSPKEHH
ncbi:MAG TPA: hypothetical protein PLF22_12940 [Pseudomonadales bacterium]|nr:hypothetical protein [Pseudomonadales bacterium]